MYGFLTNLHSYGQYSVCVCLQWRHNFMKMPNFCDTAHGYEEGWLPMAVISGAVGLRVWASVWVRGAPSGWGACCGHTTLETERPHHNSLSAI